MRLSGSNPDNDVGSTAKDHRIADTVLTADVSNSTALHWFIWRQVTRSLRQERDWMMTEWRITGNSRPPTRLKIPQIWTLSFSVLKWADLSWKSWKSCKVRDIIYSVEILTLSYINVVHCHSTRRALLYMPHGVVTLLLWALNLSLSSVKEISISSVLSHFIFVHFSCIHLIN